jgi:hypothetical protein
MVIGETQMYVTAFFEDNYKIVIFIDPRAVGEALKKFHSMGAVRVHVDKNRKP